MAIQEHDSGRRKVARVLAAALALGLLAGASLFAPGARAGSGAFERRAAKKGLTGDHDPRLNAWSFVNDRREFEGLTLVANIYVAMQRIDAPFLPIGFALVNEGRGYVALTPDRFTLVTPDGQRLPVVPYEELTQAGYMEELAFDAHQRRAADITSGYYHFASRYVRTNFFPPPGGPLRFPVVVDLYGDTYAADWLYFRNPGGLAGKVLTLEFEDAEGSAPVRKISVRFALDEPGTKKK